MALLLPITGPSADVGNRMERAASLAQPLEGPDAAIVVFDTGGTAEGAAAAAVRAISAGAPMILGPVFGREVAAVVAAAGGRPVLTFSNDFEATDGTFVLGVTPSQGTSAVLAYARDRGVRRVVLMAGADPWGRQSAIAARQVARLVGVELLEVDPAGGIDAIRAGGALPDAVMLTDPAPAVSGVAAALVEAGVQILGPSRWTDETGAVLAGLEGSWIAGPDPETFSGFARAFEATHQSAPGHLAALAYDGAMIARRLAAAGRVSREGLMTPEGFRGALGAVRFSADGRCTRELAIMVAERGVLHTVANAAGA